MSRTTLSLFALDRAALKTLSAELRQVLETDDRAGLVAMLGLAGSLAERVSSSARAVDWFLRPESDSEAAPIYASLRRITKKRALDLAWTSEEPALEGRLRQFDILREERPVAALVDKLLDPARLPWFLLRPSATAGWLDSAKREELAAGMRRLAPAFTKELTDFADALADVDGDVVAHDAL